MTMRLCHSFPDRFQQSSFIITQEEITVKTKKTDQMYPLSFAFWPTYWPTFNPPKKPFTLSLRQTDSHRWDRLL